MLLKEIENIFYEVEELSELIIPEKKSVKKELAKLNEKIRKNGVEFLLKEGEEIEDE